MQNQAVQPALCGFFVAGGCQVGRGVVGTPQGAGATAGFLQLSEIAYRHHGSGLPIIMASYIRWGMFMASINQQRASLRHAIGGTWWLILLFGLLSALFGVMALVNPVSAGASLTWAIGVLAVAEGIVGLVGAFSSAAVNRGWMVIYALVSIIFGALAIANPVSMAASIVMVAAVWFIFSGVVRIFMAILVRKEIDNEWLLILGGLLGIVLGALMLMAPVAGMIIGVVWIGVGALVYGILQIIAAFKVRKLAQ